MFSKTLFVAFFAVLSQLHLVVATPPACLLGAVKGYSDPSDIEAVCKQKDVTSKIAKLCGDNTDDALSALAEICNKSGVKVATSVIASATASGSGYAAASGYASASGMISGTGAYASATGGSNGSGSGSNGTLATTLATATGGSVPSATGSAAAPENTGAAGKLELSAAALVAGFGLLAAAL